MRLSENQKRIGMIVKKAAEENTAEITREEIAALVQFEKINGKWRIVECAGVYGSVYGSILGRVHGTVHGDVNGSVHGNISGAVAGDITGSVYGNISGSIVGDVHGNIDGDVHGDVNGEIHNRGMATERLDG